MDWRSRRLDHLMESNVQDLQWHACAFISCTVQDLLPLKGCRSLSAYPISPANEETNGTCYSSTRADHLCKQVKGEEDTTENLSEDTGKGPGENNMENSAVEESLVGRDEVGSHADLEERSVLEEKLCWTRLELQKTLAVSADADETICKLAAAARRTKQQRDEARSQRNTLLAQLQARKAQMMMLAHSRIITRPDHALAAITSYLHRARVPAAAPTPCGWMAQEQYAEQAGASYCSASSSSSSRGNHGGHRNHLASSLSIGPAQPAAACHDLASSSQDSFDPDMFLADAAAAESPQHFVPDKARGPDPGKSSGELGLVAEQMLVPRKGKVAQAVRDGTGPLLQSVTARGYDLADVVNSAGNGHTST